MNIVTQKKVIDKNTERMYKIAKSLDKDIHQIKGMDENLEILEYIIGKMREILGQEIASARKLEGLGEIKKICQLKKPFHQP